jgi:hypothetical protein
MPSRHVPTPLVPQLQQANCPAQQNLPAAPAFWPQWRALLRQLQRSVPGLIVLAGQAGYVH